MSDESRLSDRSDFYQKNYEITLPLFREIHKKIILKIDTVTQNRFGRSYKKQSLLNTPKTNTILLKTEIPHFL